MWPAPTGLPGYLRCDSKIFETKFGQDAKNQYGGLKNGEQWKVLIRGYMIGKLPMTKYILKWAEDFGTREILPGDVASIKPYLDEDPLVVDHLLCH